MDATEQTQIINKSGESKQNDKVYSTPCKLIFDKQLTFEDLNLPSNVIPVISTVLPYLKYNTDILTDMVMYVLAFSDDDNCIKKILKLIDKYLEHYGTSKNELHTIYNYISNHQVDNIPIKDDSRNEIVYYNFDLILRAFINATNLDNKNIFFNEFKILIKNKKIDFNNKIGNFIIKNSNLNINDWKILYSILLLKCLCIIGNIDIISLPINNEPYVGDYNLLVQLLSIMTCIDVNEIRETYLENYNQLDAAFIPVCTERFLIQQSPEGPEQIMDNILFFANVLKSNKIFDNKLIPGFKFININDISNIFKLNSFEISNYDINSICNILKYQKKCNILIYGPSGVGKTEFVKSILYKINTDFIKYSPIGDEIQSSKITDLFTKSFKLVQNNAVINNKVVVIDECDSLINTMKFNIATTLEKGQLNNILDQNISKNIWITNSVDALDASNFRRFDFVLKFNELSDTQKNKIWKNLLKQHNVIYNITNKEINNFIKKYNKLTPSYIDKIIKNAILNNTSKNKTNFIYNLNKEAINIYNNIFGVENSNNKNYPVKQYTLDTININYNPKDIIKSIKMFNNNQPTMAMSLLFTGMPGTGKTEFAKYISTQLNKELLIKRYSDISSCYVGETEKHIAEAFKEASDNNKILLIDECDSIFQSRENATRSWEVSQTNEFLTQLENYKGIIICTTNYAKNLDNASLRRFRYKINFEPLKYEDRITVYKKYFNKKEISDYVKNELYQMDNLCYGDIKTVYERLGALSSSFNNDEIIKELKYELSFKKDNKNSIGFC